MNKIQEIATRAKNEIDKTINAIKNINKRIDIRQAMDHYWVKGAEILLEEKEKLNNANCFLSYLIFDYFQNYNTYICK